MKALEILIEIVCFAIITVAVVVVCAASPPAALPRLQPRAEWKAVSLHGYIVDVTPRPDVAAVAMATAGPKQFIWTDTMAADGPRQALPLAFTDDFMLRRAEQLQNMPIYVRAIAVSNGRQAWWIVESIAEAK